MSNVLLRHLLIVATLFAIGGWVAAGWLLWMVASASL